MLHLNDAAFFISKILKYQIRIFTIAKNVSLRFKILNKYEAGSNYSSLKIGQYRSITEC